MGIFIAWHCFLSTELLVFGICVWNVWDSWRFLIRCNDRIRGSSGLISVLFTQSVLRCCFVVTIYSAGTFVTQFISPSHFPVAKSYTVMQNALSATLVANFTLDLRHLNSDKIEANQRSLSPLQFSNILQHVHQSFLVEMATPEERNMEEEARDHDNSPGSANDLQAAEV